MACYFATPFLTAYCLFMLFPMLYSFYLSLFEYNGIVEKHFVGLSNYINLFTKDRLFLKIAFQYGVDYVDVFAGKPDSGFGDCVSAF